MFEVDGELGFAWVGVHTEHFDCFQKFCVQHGVRIYLILSIIILLGSSMSRDNTHQQLILVPYRTDAGGPHLKVGSFRGASGELRHYWPGRSADLP